MTLDQSKYDAQITDGASEFNLLFYEEEGARAQTELLPLNAQKIDTGNVNEMRPESGFHFSQNDWRGGSGQELFHGPGSIADGFYSSDGIDVSTEGRAALLNDVALTLSWLDGGVIGRSAALEEVNGSTFAAWGGHITKPNIVWRHDGDFPGTWAEEDADAAEAGPSSVVGETRFYVQNAAAPASPSAAAHWDGDSGTEKKLAKTKTGSLAEASLETGAGADWEGLVIQAVSDPLAAGMVFATTDSFTAVFDGRHDEIANAKLRITVRVVASDDSTTQATLVSAATTTSNFDTITSGEAHGGTTRIIASTNLANAYTVVAGDYLVVEVGFVGTEASDDTVYISYGGSSSDFALSDGSFATGSGWVEFSNPVTLDGETQTAIVYDIAAKGQELFAAMGSPNGIHKRDSSGTWAHYNAATATIIRHLKDRLMAASATSLWEITASGAAPTALATVDTGWTYTDIAELGPFIYVSAVNETAGISRIYHYGVNAAGTDLEAKGSTQLPRNQLAYSIEGNGNLYIGCGRKTSGTADDSGARDPILYVGIPSATGELTLVKIAEEDDQETTSREIRSVEATEEGVMLGWEADEFHGSAVYDATTGAFVFDLTLENLVVGQGRITDMLRSVKGRSMLAVPMHGVFYEDLDVKRSSGELVTSRADFHGAGMKLWDEIRITHKPLPTGSSIAVYYSTQHPDEDDWTLAGTSNTADSEGKTFDLTNVKARYLALRFVFSRATDTSTGPELLGFTVRAFPCAEQTSDLEWRFNRYVRLFEGDSKGDNPPDHSTAGSWGGDARSRRKALMDLAYKKITLTEPDATWSVRVVGIADFEPMQPLPKSLTDKGEAYVVSMTFEGRKTA